MSVYHIQRPSLKLFDILLYLKGRVNGSDELLAHNAGGVYGNFVLANEKAGAYGALFKALYILKVVDELLAEGAAVLKLCVREDNDLLVFPQQEKENTQYHKQKGDYQAVEAEIKNSANTAGNSDCSAEYAQGKHRGRLVHIAPYLALVLF